MEVGERGTGTKMKRRICDQVLSNRSKLCNIKNGRQATRILSKINLKNMQEQHPSSHQNPTKQGNSLLTRLYRHPVSFVALLIFSYGVLLIVSYTLGYQKGLSFSRDASAFVNSEWVPNLSRYGDPVRPELVRRMIIDLVYNGTSPYEGFTEPTIGSQVQQKRIEGSRFYEAIYRSLIHKVRPKTIIKFNDFLGTSAIYMANLTRQLGLDTQILSLDDFHGGLGSQDLFENKERSKGYTTVLNQFMQNVMSQNATNSILPVSVSDTTVLEKLFKWGIIGDLIEVDVGRDFHSAWSDINKAHKLLRPGGVLFGYNHNTSYNKGATQAVKTFARVNKFRVKAGEQHWMINSV